MKKIRIAFEQKEVFDFDYAAVVIDLFRFSCTLACLLEKGKKEVKIFSDKEYAVLYHRNNPGGEFFSEIDIDNIEKFDNSPYLALNKSDPSKPAVIVTNSGSKAVMACRKAEEIFVAGFHNLPFLMEKLKNYQKDILIVPACIFYNRNHSEDFIAAEAFYNSLSKGVCDKESIFKIHNTPRILELMNFRPSTAKSDLEIIMNMGNIKALPKAKIKGNYAEVENIAGRLQ
ncbi:MAG: 2-phosphosulfolactate phosphatase [Elusimicrobiota bacterium]